MSDIFNGQCWIQPKCPLYGTFCVSYTGTFRVYGMWGLRLPYVRCAGSYSISEAKLTLYGRNYCAIYDMLKTFVNQFFVKSWCVL